MSVLVVYFSFEGNTKLIAEKIRETLNADMVELKTSKKYPTEGLGKYFWGGKSVVFGDKPTLTNESIDLSRYETIIIGTPVWAGSFAPPIRSFVNDYKIKNKRIAIFASHGGGGAVKCFAKLKEALPENKFIGETAYVEPKKNPESIDNAVKWASGLL
ncbi:flavodoxin [Lacrimispora amygdalina]|uniref:Flavodoxin n=1 Tax=Lacrimispora amygdalina TaxID=253257 RepID=A0A3E2N6T0_9FIRM|nr:flavodoxin [Clostridium indicum]RFZ76700.1 flavodoxin [Clostridium indicum]